MLDKHIRIYIDAAYLSHEQCYMPFNFNTFFIKAAFDPEEWKGEGKLHLIVAFMFMNSILMDESVQVCGVDMFVDYTGFTLAHQRFNTLSELSMYVTYISVSM